MEKVERLNDLRSEIIDKVFKKEWKPVWFYPEYKGVKGYLGTQDIFFVGSNPSFGGKFPGKYCEF